MARTTRIFDTWLAMYELLNQPQLWPPNPITGELPTIIFGDDMAIREEAVFIVTAPTDDGATTERVTSGRPGHDEVFTIQILIGSRVSSTPQIDALHRLQELVAVVEGQLRDQSTGKMAGDFNTTVPGVLWWEITSIQPQLFPLTEPESGFSGVASIDVRFTTRI
jgi:hypothetical protein